MWDLYSREDEFNSVLKEQLCECMNRDPTLPDPPKEKLCRRGQLQVRLTATFNRVSATDYVALCCVQNMTFLTVCGCLHLRLSRPSNPS